MKQLICAAMLSAALPAFAQGQNPSDTPIGSQAFCLFQLPGDATAQRWLNLGIVQYVEVRADMVVITYGGGNFGSGYEAKIPIKTSDDATAILTRLRQTAESCKRMPKSTP